MVQIAKSVAKIHQSNCR